jgi:hypothetical protein
MNDRVIVKEVKIDAQSKRDEKPSENADACARS